MYEFFTGQPLGGTVLGEEAYHYNLRDSIHELWFNETTKYLAFVPGGPQAKIFKQGRWSTLPNARSSPVVCVGARSQSSSNKKAGSRGYIGADRLKNSPIFCDLVETILLNGAIKHERTLRHPKAVEKLRFDGFGKAIGISWKPTGGTSGARLISPIYSPANARHRRLDLGDAASGASPKEQTKFSVG